jgi:hypothetical protein
MAELFTPNYGFVQPQPGTGEPQDIAKINSNFDKVEKWGRVIWVNDGVTPPTVDLIDGATVAENTSGKIWVAKKNLGGTFDKKWIRYPYCFQGYTTGFAIANGGWLEYGIQNFGGTTIGAGGPGTGPVNASAADIVASEFVVPITGIWSVKGQVKWNPNNNGVRAACFNINHAASAEDVNTADICNAPTGAGGSNSISLLEQIPAGTHIAFNLFQNSGGPLVATFVLFATLIQVTG